MVYINRIFMRKVFALDIAQYLEKRQKSGFEELAKTNLEIGRLSYLSLKTLSTTLLLAK